MRYAAWILRIATFLLLFSFAMHNTEPVVLNFFAGYQWKTPLVVALLAFFVIGVVAGLISPLLALFKARREIARLKRELNALSDRPTISHVESVEPAEPLDAVA
ncbi:LapA family protein [Parachitinimonas caeni]|uniref:LapA family protein n=1 Tax=Parachitinimonas caeni TaxID=3031301 RepID=A0ABT7E2C2_9NEIS|nr:LapA family protein [Parachitinimonas caeni]MDK2125560.1 LapA family protein [Parachitinimonas caeni]